MTMYMCRVYNMSKHVNVYFKLNKNHFLMYSSNLDNAYWICDKLRGFKFPNTKQVQLSRVSLLFHLATVILKIVITPSIQKVWLPTLVFIG